MSENENVVEGSVDAEEIVEAAGEEASDEEAKEA